MAHGTRCTSCRRRPRLADSVLCVSCGRRSLQASLTRLQQHTLQQPRSISTRDGRDDVRGHAAG